MDNPSCSFSHRVRNMPRICCLMRWRVFKSVKAMTTGVWYITASTVYNIILQLEYSQWHPEFIPILSFKITAIISTITMSSHASGSTKVYDVDIQSLESLCLQKIAHNLQTYRLEGLPTLFLQKLLPVLSVHDLHRLHQLITTKGLDSQPFWYKYYTEAFEKGWQGKKCYCVPQDGNQTPDWRQCYLDKRCSMLLNTQFITLLMPGAQPVTPSYSQKLTCQALKHPMIDPQHITTHNALQYNPIMHHPECLSLRAGSCSFLLDVSDLQSHLCASVKELQIDHLQEKYTEQVGLLLTILLGHGIIDKLTLRHSRLALVTQLKEILQICAGPVEESTEAMDTQEALGDVKGERSSGEGRMSDIDSQSGEVRGERSCEVGHTSHVVFQSRCNEDPSGSLPMKIAKTDMVTMDTQTQRVGAIKQQSSELPKFKPREKQGAIGEGIYLGRWFSGKPGGVGTGLKQSPDVSEEVMPDVSDTTESKDVMPANVFDSIVSKEVKPTVSKPEEADLFDLCFTEPIKTRDSQTINKCPSKRQPHFNMQIPKKKYDMRKDRPSRQGTMQSAMECQLCRSMQYRCVHSIRAITHVVLLGFTLDIRDCVAIGEVLAGWMVLKRIELVDNLLIPEATYEILQGLKAGSQRGQTLTHLVIEDNCVCDINAPVLLQLLDNYQRNDSNHLHTLKVRTADLFLEPPLSSWDGTEYPQPHSAVSLPSALQHIFHGIVVLDLSHQSLSQVAIYAIINALSHQDTRITHLKLESCDLRTDSLDQIFRTAKSSPSISSLNVSGNMYTANTHTGLAELLRDGALKSLDIANCKFSLHGWQEDLVTEFVNALKNTTHLQQLRLAGNQFNENDLRVLAKVFVEPGALPRCTAHNLCLDLSFNHALSPQAMIKFANTLRSSRNTSHHMTLHHLRFHASNDGVQNQELLRELRLAIPSVDLWSLHSGSDYDTFIAEQQSQM